MAKQVPTLYEWAGGSKAIDRLIHHFYDLTLQDDLLRPVFIQMRPDHVHLVAEWFKEVLGGPKHYSQQFGAMTAHPHMISRHQHLGITEEQRKRWVQLMMQAADDVGLPGDAEFRSAFVAYIEWGTRMAKMFSSGKVPVPKSAPMPSWGWGNTPPYMP